MTQADRETAGQITLVRLSGNCSMDPAEPVGYLSVSSAVYATTLMLLSALNVCLNAFALRILPGVMPRRNPAYRLLASLSMAEIVFNASAMCNQTLVYVYGRQRRAFSSPTDGFVACSSMQALLLLHQTMHRFRNWTVVFIGWCRFGGLFRCCGRGVGAGDNDERSRLSGYPALLLNFAMSLALSAPKLLENNAIVCLSSLRLSQESTWLADEPAYRIGYTYIASYLSSTVAPVALLVGLHGCILRSLVRDRRQWRRSNQAENGAATQPTHAVSPLTASPRHGDLLIATLVATFCLCELPAFVAVFVYFHSANRAVSHHLVHLAHLGTALDSTLNLLIYIFPYRRVVRYVRLRRVAAKERKLRRERELQLAPMQRRRRRHSTGGDLDDGEDDEEVDNNSPTRGFTTVGQTNSQGNSQSMV